ncbi:TORTIFOLIA1-like protein 2 isoform X2 [Chenopodium quinoa]|uniref:TOG domain-containing protein n=1 Tax=Chenopodium quinoa TaxID=63459 RepID=A0A803MEU2_CHEQI|nr:TORTIFOLIA1-like protein 2 isoform X1 [Chenopodium quinoa]XP_021715874.1 TORTIFOLIA1-like protein 2 isoform X2 [Chenopodium quinoa]
MMKRRTEVKSRGPKKAANPQHVVYELKHRVVLAINKIADRDTYQIGVQELEKTAESLNLDGLVPFLSCILDSDSEQKSAVRKECVRMMGVLVKMHGNLLGPHLGKMVASIVKRLKDQDSVVRDTCVETMGVFASEFGNRQVETDGVFVLLVRPLFEALGDQNKQIQAGAAMCLARVIENMNDPPVSILQKMLARTMKLLKNPHFKAKPAVIELNKSLIQAGGALSHSALSTAICSIQEALKDSDWTTRKAASLALGEIASSGGPFLVPFKASCIQALESCRFDKVKPVRDTVSQALHCWRSIGQQDVPEPSDSLCGDDCSDLITAGSSLWKGVSHTESKTNVVRNRASDSRRKGSPNFVEISSKSNNSDWHVDVAVPKMHSGIPQYLHNDESGSSSVCKTQETVTADVISMQEVGHEYDLIEDKQEYSSASNRVSDNFTNKFVSDFHCNSRRGDITKSAGGDNRFSVGKDDVETEKQSYISKLEDRRSLDSTVTEADECHSVRVYRPQTENEIISIQKQLIEIENKQSRLMDILQGFTTSTMETLSIIQLKVSSLEHAVDRIVHDLAQGGKYSDLASRGSVEKSRSVISSGISNNSTPRQSIETQERNLAAQCSSNRNSWEGKAVGMKNKSNPISPCVDSRRQPLSMVNRNHIREGPEKSTGPNLQNTTYHRSRKTDIISSNSQGNPRQNGRVGKNDIVSSTSHGNTQLNGRVDNNDLWKYVKSLLCEGDLDSAYTEALYSGDQLLLIELIDGTGPVLDSLSNETINNLFTVLASCASEHRIVESIIPWLQQIVDLSTMHGPNYVPLSLKVKRDILLAVQEALDVEVTHPTKRRLVAQLAMKLQQIWG